MDIVQTIRYSQTASEWAEAFDFVIGKPKDKDTGPRGTDVTFAHRTILAAQSPSAFLQHSAHQS
ncbi:hypothetical protein [Arthrobacter psychrolactophilus]|nr:hypothetical protein [Arthrobacter psychrolactophilus]